MKQNLIKIRRFFKKIYTHLKDPHNLSNLITSISLIVIAVHAVLLLNQNRMLNSMNEKQQLLRNQERRLELTKILYDKVIDYSPQVRSEATIEYLILEKIRSKHSYMFLEKGSFSKPFRTLSKNGTLAKANLIGTIFVGYSFPETSFRRADLQDALFSDGNFKLADFSEANLSRVTFEFCNLVNVSFHKTNLYKANLTDNYINGSSFYGANLERADLRGTDFSGSNFNEANLKDANLSKVYITKADLRKTHGLTQIQINSSRCSKETMLPPGLVITEECLNN